MAIDEKAGIGLVVIILIAATLLVISLRGKTRIVEIIYFKGSSCIVVNATDQIIDGIRTSFKDKVSIRTINIGDESLSAQDKQLIEKHQVIGVPEIIVNGKEYADEFTKEGLEREICRRFLIKPEACR